MYVSALTVALIIIRRIKDNTGFIHIFFSDDSAGKKRPVRQKYKLISNKDKQDDLFV